MQKITPFLMFNNQAEEAINFYTSVFKNSRVISRMQFGDSVMGGTFELEGQEFQVFNGGPHFTFSQGISLFIKCEVQEEVDYYWEKLSEGGEEEMCGWVKDKFGVSWQIIPTILGELLQHRDPVKAKRAMDAMLQMKKLDIKKLKDAVK